MECHCADCCCACADVANQSGSIFGFIVFVVVVIIGLWAVYETIR